MKFAVAVGKSPGHGPDKAGRGAYNFLPKHTTEYGLKAIERKIMHKLEDRCEVKRCVQAATSLFGLFKSRSSAGYSEWLEHQ